jgi:hypothetical protein
MIRALRIWFAASGLLSHGCPSPVGWQCRAREASLPFNDLGSYVPIDDAETR